MLVQVLKGGASLEEQKGKKKNSKKRKIPLFLIIMFLGVSLFALGRMVYAKYVVPRPVEFTTFSPFERRIFDLDASEIAAIRFFSWERVYSNGTRRAPFYTFDTKEEIETFVEYLNSFRYTHTAPGPDPVNLGKEGLPACRFLAETKNGENFHCSFEQNRVYIGEVWYYGDPGFFQKLMDLEK
ncbi:hypothetical protein [Neglectibacter caecimuris]|uniref:hypothetical protein n=1 Tax=Neglectibacter caecimuris TaxID=3093658 RepID=UPI002AC984B9|nr:hypothetical protein [Neglectibacter sp. M00184]